MCPAPKSAGRRRCWMRSCRLGASAHWASIGICFWTPAMKRCAMRAVVSCAVLIAAGIDPSGHRSLLGVSVSLSEADVYWCTFLAGLQERGLYGVQLIVSDDHGGLKAAREARFPGVAWQRCQFHLQQNAGHYAPRVAMRSEIAADL